MPLFDWDPDKNALNQRKHKIRFEDAIKIFANEDALVTKFNRIEKGEERWQSTGKVTNDANDVILVIHTIEENGTEFYRIISARKLKPHERRKHGYH